MKALRKCLKEEVETNKKLVERVKELEIVLQSKDDALENVKMNNQRLVKRIETLQQKEAQQPQAASGGSWGLFGGGSTVNHELQQAK